MPAMAGQGPFFDELTVGQEFTAPAMTVTAGLAAAHQAITGDRLALMLDHELCHQVTGGGPLAPPGLVWDIAIGQSTVVTQHVKANLFYRGLAFRRAPLIGDTLSTVTQVVALRQNKPRDRPRRHRARGAADHHDRPGEPAGPGLLALRHAAAGRSGSADRARGRPRTSRPGQARRRTSRGWSAAGDWTDSRGGQPGPGPPSCTRGCPSRWLAATSSPVRPSWPG